MTRHYDAERGTYFETPEPAPSASAPDGTQPFPSQDYERGYRDGYNNGLAEGSSHPSPAAPARGEWREVLAVALGEHEAKHGKLADEYLPKHWTHAARRLFAAAPSAPAQGEWRSMQDDPPPLMQM